MLNNNDPKVQQGMACASAANKCIGRDRFGYCTAVGLTSHPTSSFSPSPATYSNACGVRARLRWQPLAFWGVNGGTMTLRRVWFGGSVSPLVSAGTVDTTAVSDERNTRRTRMESNFLCRPPCPQDTSNKKATIRRASSTATLQMGANGRTQPLQCRSVEQRELSAGLRQVPVGVLAFGVQASPWPDTHQHATVVSTLPGPPTARDSAVARRTSVVQGVAVAANAEASHALDLTVALHRVCVAVGRAGVERGNSAGGGHRRAHGLAE